MKTGKSVGHVSRTALESMKHKIDELPLLPQVLVRILQINTSQVNYFEKIDQLAQQDPPFAIRLLAIANSASYAPVSPVRSIKEALTRVGASTITSLVASLAVQRVFMPSTKSEVALWRHSIGVAVAAETIAGLMPTLRVNKGQVYLAGLLHDIGRFVMFEHAPKNLIKVDESNWSSPEDLIAADVEIFKYTHSELGYLACTRWGMPDELARTVRRHHEELEGVIKPGSVEASIICVEIADRLEIVISKQSENDSSSLEELTEEIEQNCLRLPQVKKLINTDVLVKSVDKIKAQSEALISGLGLS